MTIQVAGASPNAHVGFLGALGPGGPRTVPAGQPCGGLQIDLNVGAQFLGLVRADAQGRASLGPAIVPASAQDRARLQAVDLTACATTNVAQVLY